MAAEYPPPESIPPYAADNPPSPNYALPPIYPPTGANPCYADVEAVGGAGKPSAATGGEPESGGSSRMSSPFIGIGLRAVELASCIASFVLIIIIDDGYSGYTDNYAGAFLLATTVIGFTLSLPLLVILVASLFFSALRRFQGKLRLFQVVEGWLLSLLLFAAACTCAVGTTESECGYFSSYNGKYYHAGQDCELVRGSFSMAFIASFTYICGFWYYATRVLLQAVKLVETNFCATGIYQTVNT